MNYIALAHGVSPFIISFYLKFVSLALAQRARKGRAIDNVFIERLWRSVKYEFSYLQEWDTVFNLKKGLTEYFNFYNFERPHQSLDGKTPASVYLMN